MPYLNRFPGAKESHEIHPIFGNPVKHYQCRICLCTWKKKPHHGKCAGVPVYDSWENAPEQLVTSTAMYRDWKRKLPETSLPVAAVRHETSSYTPLYLLNQGNPDYEGKRKSTKVKQSVLDNAPNVTQKFDPFGWLTKGQS